MELEVLKHCKERFDNQEGQNYPCGNQAACCAIITYDKDKAESIMHEKGAVKTLEGKYRTEWHLDDERWMWRNKWSENTRGYRFYKLIIDKDIDEETFYFIKRLAYLYCCSMEIV